MKVTIVKEVMTGDVLPVAMFVWFIKWTTSISIILFRFKGSSPWTQKSKKKEGEENSTDAENATAEENAAAEENGRAAAEERLLGSTPTSTIQDDLNR